MGGVPVLDTIGMACEDGMIYRPGQQRPFRMKLVGEDSLVGMQVEGTDLVVHMPGEAGWGFLDHLQEEMEHELI